MKKLTLGCLILLSAGCSHSYNLVSLEKDAWIQEQTSIGAGSSRELLYCRGNPGKAGDAYPVCYSPTFLQGRHSLPPEPEELRPRQSASDERTESMRKQIDSMKIDDKYKN